MFFQRDILADQYCLMMHVFLLKSQLQNWLLINFLKIIVDFYLDVKEINKAIKENLYNYT